MTPEREEQIQRIVGEVSNVPPADRSAALNRLCGDDRELREEVERLLAQHDAWGDLLETEAIHEAHRAAQPHERSRGTVGLGPGDSVGPYRILDVLGEGGMGVVYLADQTEPVRRRVALKIIKPGMDSQQVIARFESERQALALMNHPNVARALGAGTTEDGRPYFVMEHVPGVPITDYCDRHRLNTSERLELFTEVCRGIQHAHQKGVIHRDIKPSNVLVLLQDSKPVPKVIDFGVAKATHQRLSERTVFTRQGQLVGTLEYMSPEQAEMTALDVDTRTDIYSLGVLLYQLLTGALPFDPEKLRQAAFGEIQRIIREQLPPKPSTRLSSLDGERSGEVAHSRSTSSVSLTRQLRGDIDWIIMKALEKDRVRRYATASEFAADVDRYIRHEPIAARPPSAMYRMRVWARRHRTSVTAAASVLLVITTSSVVTLRMVWRAHDLLARVEAEAATKLAIVSIFLEGLRGARPSENSDGLLLALITRIGSEDLLNVIEDPLVEAESRLLLGETLISLDEWHDAIPHLRRAHSLFELNGERRRVLDVQNELAAAMYFSGDRVGAASAFEELLQLRRQVDGPDHVDTWSVAGNLAATYQEIDRLEEARLLLSDLVGSQTRTLGRSDTSTLHSMHNLASVYYLEGQYELARRLHEETLGLRRSVQKDADLPPAIITQWCLGGTLCKLGRFDKAEPLIADALAAAVGAYEPDHIYLAWAYRYHAEALVGLGQLPEAHQDLQRAREIVGDRNVYPRLIREISDLESKISAPAPE